MILSAGQTALIHGPLRDEPPAIDDADPVAHFLGNFERMGAHEDGDALFAHATEHVLDQARAPRVEADHRFVHHNGLRSMQECRAHDQTLLHSVRKALDEPVFPSPQFEKVEHLPNARANVIVSNAVQATVEPQKLRRGELLVRAAGRE